jgi:hypothetical protein
MTLPEMGEFRGKKSASPTVVGDALARVYLRGGDYCDGATGGVSLPPSSGSGHAYAVTWYLAMTRSILATASLMRSNG